MIGHDGFRGESHQPKTRRQNIMVRRFLTAHDLKSNNKISDYVRPAFTYY